MREPSLGTHLRRLLPTRLSRNPRLRPLGLHRSRHRVHNHPIRSPRMDTSTARREQPTRHHHYGQYPHARLELDIPTALQRSQRRLFLDGLYLAGRP